MVKQFEVGKMYSGSNNFYFLLLEEKEFSLLILMKDGRIIKLHKGWCRDCKEVI